MKAPARPGLLTVATRELRWMRRDEVALLLSIIVPVIAFAVLTLTFSNAVIRNLRVTIVDADRSATSLTYVQAIGSAPGVSVAERSADMTGAMRAIRSGDAIAAVYIPENFERDLLARQRPQIVTLYNRQYFTPGNNANSTISSAIAAATATLPRGGDGGGYRPGALVSEQYVLSNPALNYAQFLLRAILPTVLHVVIALAAGYAVGSEFSRRSKRAWMRAAGGRPLVALVGKLTPLFGALRHHGSRRRRHPACPVRRLVSRRPGHGRGGRAPAYSRLSRARGAARPPDAEPGLGPEPDRHLLQPGLRLCRRRISDRCDERLRPRLGRDPAPALVSASPVRSGGARRASVGFRKAVHGPGRPRLPLFFPRLAAAARDRQRAAPSPRSLRSRLCKTAEASPSPFATRRCASSATGPCSA